MYDLITQLKTRHANSSEATIYWRMWWLATLVHGTLFLSAIASVGVVGLAIYYLTPYSQSVFLLWILLILVALVHFYYARAIYHSPIPDLGIELQKSDSPTLFKTIEDVARDIAPKLNVEKVWLTTEFNAAAYSSRAAKSLFRKSRQIRLGLPLFYSLSTNELKGVIAHELVHIQAKHIGNRPWIRTAQKASWHAQFLAIHFLVRSLLRSLHRKLWAYQTILSTRNEFLADQAQARAAGPDSSAASLLRTIVINDLFSERFQSSFELYLDSESPPAEYFELHKQVVKSFFDNPDVSKKLANDELNRAYGLFVPHPELPIRIEAFGANPNTAVSKCVAPVSPSSVEIFGDRLESIESRMNQYFVKENNDQWNRWHQYYQSISSDFVPIDRIETQDQAWIHFEVISERDGIRFTQPSLNRILELTPTNKLAQAHLARCRLAMGLDDAEAEVEALTDSPSFIVADLALTDLRTHYGKAGNRQKLHELEAQVEPMERRRSNLYFEQQRASYFGKYESAMSPGKEHGTDGYLDSQLEHWRKIFAEIPAISKVHVARKRLKHCCQTRCLVFVISFWPLSNSGNAILNQIRENLNLRDSTIVIENSSLNLASRKIKRLNDSLIYQHTK